MLADAEGHPGGVGVEGGGDQEADEVDETQHVDGADEGGCSVVWGEKRRDWVSGGPRKGQELRFV